MCITSHGTTPDHTRQTEHSISRHPFRPTSSGLKAMIAWKGWTFDRVVLLTRLTCLCWLLISSRSPACQNRRVAKALAEGIVACRGAIVKMAHHKQWSSKSKETCHTSQWLSDEHPSATSIVTAKEASLIGHLDSVVATLTREIKDDGIEGGAPRKKQ